MNLKTPQTLQYQFICVGCGIPFSSLDYLTTHQTYYCTKRQQETAKAVDEKSRRCTKCKVSRVSSRPPPPRPGGERPRRFPSFQAIVNGEHQCIGSSANSVVSGWKCPCCDVVSPTAAAAQKHMDTHQGVRAFRCRVCKYKGNTLRGMRTHVRTHFDKNTNDLQVRFGLRRAGNPVVSFRLIRTGFDFQGENYITCILDEEHEQPSQPPANNGVADSARTPSEVVVKVEVGAEDEFVDVDAVDQPQPQRLKEDIDPGDEDDKLTPNNNSKKINYCKSCDITFTYSSSLIAHKKFYCSAVSAENEAQSKSSRTTPETSVQ